MKNKILIIIVLLGLLPFSCGKLELTKTGNDPLNESANGTLKDGLLPLCNIADAVVGKIGITSVVGNTFQYKFVVSNAGAGILYLNRMYFQTYLSEDAILDAADQAAGGSIFGDTAPALNFHESFTQAWYYNPTSPVDITRYHFVIIQVLVRPKFSMPECSTTNNVRAQDIGCNLSEAFISNITINNKTYIGRIPGAWQVGQVSQPGFADLKERSTLGCQNAALVRQRAFFPRIRLKTAYRINAPVIGEKIRAIQARNEAFSPWRPGCVGRFSQRN